jgi:hypothetical protein
MLAPTLRKMVAEHALDFGRAAGFCRFRLATRRGDE